MKRQLHLSSFERMQVTRVWRCFRQILTDGTDTFEFEISILTDLKYMFFDGKFGVKNNPEVPCRNCWGQTPFYPLHWLRNVQSLPQ